MTYPEGYDRALAVCERVYRALLVAYPKEVKREYGAQMEQAFRDLCREALDRAGMVGLLGLWVLTLLDLATSALAERKSGLRRANGEEVPLRRDRRLAGIGFALLLAPLYFVSASLLKYGLGVGLLFDLLQTFLAEPGRREVFNLVSPAVFFGGLGLGLALNAYVVLRPGFGRENGAVVCTIRLETKVLNITVVAVSALLLVTLLGYVFLENFAYR